MRRRISEFLEEEEKKEKIERGKKKRVGIIASHHVIDQREIHDNARLRVPKIFANPHT